MENKTKKYTVLYLGKCYGLYDLIDEAKAKMETIFESALEQEKDDFNCVAEASHSNEKFEDAYRIMRWSKGIRVESTNLDDIYDGNEILFEVEITTIEF